MNHMSTIRRALAVILATAVAAVPLLAGPAAAASYGPLDASGIEQVVLRAQMPRTLGAWSQNIYYTWATDDTRYAPTVCYAANGEQVKLPHGKTGGGVGYAVSPTINTSVTLYQYANQEDADAALAALRKADCPDSTKVRTDVNSVVPGDQAADFTSADQNGIGSIVTYRYDDGAGMTTVTEIRMTTQVGLAVVHTEVGLAGSATKTSTVNRAMKLARSWHARSLAAYRAFGAGASH